MTRPPRGHRGFVMMAMVLVLSTIALAVFLAKTQMIFASAGARTMSAQASQSKIQQALVQYAAIYRRLPCPANPSLATTSALAGWPDQDSNIYNSHVTCSYPGGIVPWKALGLAADDVMDVWGQMISYRVFDGLIGLTQDDGASRIKCDTDNGPVPDSAPILGLCADDYNTPPARFTSYALFPTSSGLKGLVVSDFGTTVTKVAYVLISHGPSGRGGYRATGQRVLLPDANAGDYPNTRTPVYYPSQAPASFVRLAQSAADVDAGSTGHFDDLVSYMTIDDLVKYAKLSERDWPDKLPTFDAATTSNMTEASTDPINPHFMSTGAAGSGQEFTAVTAAGETVVSAGTASTSYSSCLWWPTRLTLDSPDFLHSLNVYVEFSSVDNTSDAFSGFTLGFLAGTSPAPTNDTCGSTYFSRTATGTAGNNFITVTDTSGIELGLNVVGTGVGTSSGGTYATITGISGTTLFLSQNNSATFSGTVTFANSRLIRRDMGWAGGTLATYTPRFALEVDTNSDTSSFTNPTAGNANDPSALRPHLAIDYDGVVHGTNAESCTAPTSGAGCDIPPSTFTGVTKTATIVAGSANITVSDVTGIVHGMPVSGSGIGSGATVVDIAGNVVTLGTSAVASSPVLNTSSGTTSAFFSSLSSSNFLQNRLSVFHSARAEITPQACVTKNATGSVSLTTLSVSSASGIAVGMGAYGSNIASGATVLAIVGTTLTLSNAHIGNVTSTVHFSLMPATSKTATGSFGGSTITVSSNLGIGINMTASGAGIATGALVTGISGNTITLSAANTGSVSGSVTFTPPSQLKTASGTGGQNTVTVSDTRGVAAGMGISGTGIATGATISSIAGNVLTLSATNTGAVSGNARIRPSLVMVKGWVLSAASCNADTATCNALKDTANTFGTDTSTDNTALHSAACLAAPTPSSAYERLYFGLTTSNRALTSTGTGVNVSFRRLAVGNPAVP